METQKESIIADIFLKVSDSVRGNSCNFNEKELILIQEFVYGTMNQNFKMTSSEIRDYLNVDLNQFYKEIKPLLSGKGIKKKGQKTIYYDKQDIENIKLYLKSKVNNKLSKK